MLKEDRRPLYVRTAEQLERFINESKLHPGDQLPSETALATSLGVGRSTLREALRELELRGRVERIHGRGTILATPSPITTGLETLESLESLATRQGWQCGTESVSVVEEPSTPEIAAKLEIASGAPVTCLRRVKTRDWEPIGHMTTWLPASRFPADGLRQTFRSSITDLLREDDATEFDYASAQVGAVGAAGDVAVALKVTPNTPLISLLETFFDVAGKPICHSVNLFIPESIRLETIRRPVRRQMN